MNPSTKSEVLSEADPGKEHGSNPRVHSVPSELCSNEQTPPRNPVGRYAPDEGGFESFVRGAGI